MTESMNWPAIQRHAANVWSSDGPLALLRYMATNVTIIRWAWALESQIPEIFVECEHCAATNDAIFLLGSIDSMHDDVFEEVPHRRQMIHRILNDAYHHISTHRAPCRLPKGGEYAENFPCRGT